VWGRVSAGAFLRYGNKLARLEAYVFCLWKVLLFDFELSACLLSLRLWLCVRECECVLWTKAENGPNNIIKFNALIFHGPTNARTLRLAKSGSRKPRAGQINKSSSQLYRFILKSTARMIESFQSHKTDLHAYEAKTLLFFHQAICSPFFQFNF